MYVLQPKADPQGTKIPFTDIPWMSPYVVEKALPNNNSLVQKLETNKAQVLHRMRLRLFSPRRPKPDVQTTSQEWKPDSQVIIKHDDLYTRAWESEYETLTFVTGQHEPNKDNSPEIKVRHDLPNEEMCTIPGTIQEDSPERIPHTDEVGERTNTDHYMELDAEAFSEQLSPTNVNPRSAKYDLRHNRKTNCSDYYRY